MKRYSPEDFLEQRFLFITSHQIPKEGWFSNNVCDKVIKREVAWGSRAKSCWVYTGKWPTLQIGSFPVKGQKKDSKIWLLDNHDRWLGENSMACTWKCRKGSTFLMTRTSGVWRRGQNLARGCGKSMETNCYKHLYIYQNCILVKRELYYHANTLAFQLIFIANFSSWI